MNNQNELFYGSICVTDFLEQANKKHSGFSKGNNGKIYAAVNIWLNGEPDKYGNTISVQLQSTKEKKDSEPKVYLGNAKKADNSPKPISGQDLGNLKLDGNGIEMRKSGHYSEVPAGSSGGTDVASDGLQF